MFMIFKFSIFSLSSLKWFHCLDDQPISTQCCLNQSFDMIYSTEQMIGFNMTESELKWFKS